MTTQLDKLYSIEECDEIWKRKDPGWDHVSRAFKQLADVMCENEKLREALTNIEICVWGDNFKNADAKLEAIDKLAEDALYSSKQSLRKEFAQTSIDMFKPQGTPILDSLMGKPKSSDITDK